MFKRFSVLAVCVLAARPVAAAPKAPVVEEVKGYAVDATGALVPYTKDHYNHDVVIAVKVSGTTPNTTLALTFTATKIPAMPASAYAAAGKKPPPKTKVKFSRSVRVNGRVAGDPDTVWVLLPVEVGCYEASQVELGTSKKPITFDGTCVEK